MLTITARAMGVAGNAIDDRGVDRQHGRSRRSSSGAARRAGSTATWRTDLAATPRIESRGAGLDAELLRGAEGVRDRRRGGVQHGIAARGRSAGRPGSRNGIRRDACWLNTPALQTNFGPAEHGVLAAGLSRTWRHVMAEAGVRPYLQFGEVQWWYFADASGMPFYDAYTKSAIPDAVRDGRWRMIASQHADPAAVSR